MLGLIRDQILLRLEANEIPTLKSANIVLNTEGWESNNDDDDFADNDIRVLFNQFELPLKNAGLTCSVDELLEEWHTLVGYTTNYLNHSGLSYTRLWHKLFNSSRKSEWSNMLLLIELLFCLPVSNAVVER